jgi:effector-binding domain-containing protein
MLQKNFIDMDTLTKYNVKEVTWPEKVFLTQRATVDIDRLTEFFGETYGAIYEAMERLGIQSYDPPCAIYYSIDEDNWETDLAAAIPVEGKIPPLDFEKVIIPESKVLMVAYYGDYDSMAPAYQALEKYAATQTLKKMWMSEEYLWRPAAELEPRIWKADV